MGHLSYVNAVADADALIRLGQRTVFLEPDAPDLPWHLVDDCEPGGMYRSGVCISGWMIAPHPSGLIFKWSVDVEPRDADGQRTCQIDARLCREIRARLPAGARKGFRQWMGECAAEIAKTAAQCAEAARHQSQLASELLKLANEADEVKS